MGHPVLLRVAESLTKERLATPEIQTLIDDMIETMRDERGVGLAAPQVHESLRLFVMDPNAGEEESEPRVVVNPVLSFPNEERISLWEGCLSIPGIRGETERFADVEVRAWDRHGKPWQASFQDFAAAVVQHETDHLDGLFFFTRMPDPNRIAFEEEFSRYVRDAEDHDCEGDCDCGD
jgi:peptide deformylase